MDAMKRQRYNINETVDSSQALGNQCSFDSDCSKSGFICRSGYCVEPNLPFEPCQFHPLKQTCGKPSSGPGSRGTGPDLKCAFATGMCHDPKLTMKPLPLFCAHNGECWKEDYCAFPSLEHYKHGKGMCRPRKKLYEGCGSVLFYIESQPDYKKPAKEDEFLFEQCERPFRCSKTQRICVPTCLGDQDCRKGVFANRISVHCDRTDFSCAFSAPPVRLYVPGQEHKAAFRAAFKSIRSAAKISETALGGDGSAEPPAPTSQGLPAEYLWPAVGVGIVLFVVAMSLVLLCVKKCKSGSSKPVIPNIDLSALPSPFQSATSAPAMPKLRTEGDTLKKTLPSLFSSKDSAGLPPPPSYN